MRARLLAITLLLGACSNGEQETGETCVPGASIACTCSSGSEGAQVCEPDGMSLSMCMCEEATTDSDTTGDPSETTETDSGETTDASDTGETEDTTDTGGVECGGVVNGNIEIENDFDLEQLVGVSEIEGSLAVPAGLAMTDELSCLRVVTGSVDVVGDYDFSHIAALESATSLRLESPSGGALPTFHSLGDVYTITLSGLVGGSFPLLDSVGSLNISEGSCPDIAAEIELIVASEVNEPGCLQASSVIVLEVARSSTIPEALVTGGVSLGTETTSMSGLRTADTLSPPEGYYALEVVDTSLSSLEGWTNPSVSGNGYGITDNDLLDDISALTNSSVDGLSALNVVCNPGITQEHFDTVAETFDTDGAIHFQDC